jgi:hypothetical protein
MRLIIIIIVWTSLLSGCVSSAPKPPIIKKCDIVAVEGGNPYLYCRWSNGSTERFRIPISDLYRHEEKYICTDDVGYAEAYKYGQNLKRWTDQHCK